MFPLAECKKCGLRFRSIYQDSITQGVATFSRNRERCPGCGASVESPEGVFRFGTELFEEVLSGAVTRQDIAAFRKTAEEVRAGAKLPNQAASEVEKSSLAFAKILRLANENPAVLDLVEILMTLLFFLYTAISSNADARQAHADALSQVSAIQEQTGEMKKLNEAIAQLDAISSNRAAGPNVRDHGNHLPDTQRRERPKNRRERRAAAAKHRP